MLTGETLKPYLLHEDPWIRSDVAQYFHESWSQDKELVPMILDASEQYGFENNKFPLAYCDRFPVTSDTFNRVLQLLSDASDNKTTMHLSSILSHAPIDILHKYENAIRNNQKLLENHSLRVKHRLNLMSWSGERLWQEVQNRVLKYKDTEWSSEFDNIYDEAIIETLALHDVPNTETICRLLTTPSDDDGWLDMFLVDLAGARRLREAVPAIMDKLRRTDEDYPENTSVVLTRIGHPDIVRNICRSYRDESWLFQDVSASLLGEIKHPDSEEAILCLLQEEDDIETRTNLCYGLCQLFSERGVEIVLQQIRDGYEEWIVSLEESILPVAEILGITLPKAGEWRRKREEIDLLHNEWRRPMNEPDEDFYVGQDGEAFSTLEALRDFDPTATRTYRRPDAKIGRNDPCPCGSGKKYKKCCGG